MYRGESEANAKKITRNFFRAHPTRFSFLLFSYLYVKPAVELKQGEKPGFFKGGGGEVQSKGTHQIVIVFATRCMLFHGHPKTFPRRLRPFKKVSDLSSVSHNYRDVIVLGKIRFLKYFPFTLKRTLRYFSNSSGL